ncbi:MAG: bifunctional phosphopantothenoylcysteine decarboxylase/phosphopantothenate--cysteine ligase CoaBC [Flavobacteriales bacterium]
MSLFRDKNILLGISASIAAYKSATLVREFIKHGANVKVIMTPESKQFVTPLTLSTLSKNKVLSTLVKEDDKDVWNNHVELGQWADFMVIAPATAKTISKMAQAECDNLLLTTYLSAPCPVYFAPAMDLDMLLHQSTQDNIDKLKSIGNIYIPVDDGELASGLVGKGRMAEPEDIVDFIQNHHIKKLPLFDKKVMITAGPTYEQIDPVRFIGNNSSGKMGYAIAKEMANQGAMVTLISGPSNQQLSHSNINIINVRNAKDMLTACINHYDSCDIAVMTAAVSDYTPVKYSEYKLKKKSLDLDLKLVPTKDILKHLGSIKTHQILVGFALETDNEVENAKIKLQSKNLDFIVLNSLKDKGAGFQVDTNKISIVNSENKITNFELKSKKEVAKDITQYLIHNFV